MLTDPIKAFWISLAVGFSGFAWLVAFALAGDALHRMMGDAAFALTLLALLAFLAGLIVAVVFLRFARIRAALIEKQALARWRVSEKEWRDFAADVAPEAEADRRAIFLTIVAFGIAIPAIMALLGGDPAILSGIALMIIAIAAAGLALGRRMGADQARYRSGLVALGARGLLVNDMFHSWDLLGSKLVSAEIVESGGGLRLQLVYAYLLRGNLQYVTVRAPIPPQAADDARAAVQRLTQEMQTPGAADAAPAQVRSDAEGSR